MADLVQPQWYVVHTYSGYENKVKANLEKTIENNGLEDMIQEISIPIEEAIEIKNGFVGGSRPTPLSETDFASIGQTQEIVRVDIEPGDEVRVLAGPFKDWNGRVTEIDTQQKRIRVLVTMLKRELSIDLAYDEVVRISD